MRKNETHRDRERRELRENVRSGRGE